jgi:hypothetical protein
MFKNLAELGLHAVGGQAHGLGEQPLEAAPLQSRHSNFSKYFLLPYALVERTRRRRRRSFTGFGLDHRGRLIVASTGRTGHD